ncbi:spore coat protein [Xylanibacillus composti]|uniref:Spore protein YkvP n=1 Tax=Xylanibacillus composti TaxID=1572762 RepID=A0A8J4H2W7_9BACL|nr:glycosyltransferase [Xylanibacillus composti]MDT9723448.1 spore coat protein [Xylanibacillus composti]GIQ68516.1 spore protein YkvP [Xylanibacillus composti]
MRILAQFSLDVFRLSMGWALESLGHRVYHLNDASEQSLEEAVRMHKPDFYIDMGWDAEHCDPLKVEAIRTVLKRHGVFHVYYAEEDGLHFEYWSKRYIEWTQPDFVLTRGEACVGMYEAMGIPSRYLDVGCNEQLHRPVAPSPELECEVSAIANVQHFWDIYRRRSIRDLIVPLFQSGLHVQLWGKDWEHAAEYYGTSPAPGMHKGNLPFHRTPAAFNSAKINIGVQSIEEQISNRTYEIMASGGFLLTSGTAQVHKLLQPGLCCEVSNSPEETLDKIHYYLNHEDERRRIAMNGMQLAREKFSYSVTLPPALETIAQHIRQRGGAAVG